MTFSPRSSAQWVFVGLAALLPLLILSTSWGGSGSFYLLLAASGTILALNGKPLHELLATAKSYRTLTVALFILVASVLVSQAWHSSWYSSEFEKCLRFTLGLVILAAALLIPRDQLQYAILGIIAATWYGALNVAWLAYISQARPAPAEFNAVSYGDLILLFATITFLSRGCQITPYRQLESAFKLTTAVVGLLGFALTQTRGGLLAIPCFILIWLMSLRRWSVRLRLITFAVAIAVFAFAVQANSSLRSRIDAGIDEYAQCAVSPLEDTSICIRLQLWAAARDMIASEPLLGVGGGRKFRESLHTRYEKGEVSAVVAQDYGETHNDLLYFFATYGVLGCVGILAIYLGPICYLAPRLRRAADAERAAAAAGLALCIGFAVFGLSEMMFRGMRTASLYVTWMVIFLAMSQPQQMPHDSDHD